MLLSQSTTARPTFRHSLNTVTFLISEKSVWCTHALVFLRFISGQEKITDQEFVSFPTRSSSDSMILRLGQLSRASAGSAGWVVWHGRNDTWLDRSAARHVADTVFTCRRRWFNFDSDASASRLRIATSVPSSPHAVLLLLTASPVSASATATTRPLRPLLLYNAWLTASDLAADHMDGRQNCQKHCQAQLIAPTAGFCHLANLMAWS